MKKTITVLAAAALVSAMAVPAFAASQEEGISVDTAVGAPGSAVEVTEEQIQNYVEAMNKIGFFEEKDLQEKLSQGMEIDPDSVLFYSSDPEGYLITVTKPDGAVLQGEDIEFTFAEKGSNSVAP